VPVLPAWITDPLWDQFHALLPERIDQHPLGCHRPRIPDRIVFDKLVQVLVFGCCYQRVADHTCSERTLRRRRDEWIAAGVADQVHRLAVAAYDHLIGLELDHLAVDGCITRRPAAARLPAQARSTAASVAPSDRWWWRAGASRLALSPQLPTAAMTACWP
jgi:transposase